MQFMTVVMLVLLCSVFLEGLDQRQAKRNVDTLADDYVHGFASYFPEQAELSDIPLSSYDGLSDNSLHKIKQWKSFEDGLRLRLNLIDANSLRGTQEWVTLGYLKEAVDSSIQLRICQPELWPVSQLTGWQVSFAQLAGEQPVETAEGRKQALDRWRQLPRYLAEEIKNLNAGSQIGYTTPKHNVELVINQIDELLKSPIEDSPFDSPAKRAADSKFAAAWTQMLKTEIEPAMKTYRDFLATKYLARARRNIALSSTPNGKACYQAFLRLFTSLQRSGSETYQRGLSLVAQNESKALKIAQTQLNVHDLQSLASRSKADPANHFKSADELMVYTRAAVSKSKVASSKWFAELPKEDVVVEPNPNFNSNANSRYWPASGGKPATFSLSVTAFAQTTRSEAEVTAYHETYPGHHLQNGLANSKQNHMVTRLVGISAFQEGWARYAEGLADEMGLYESEYARAGRLAWPGRGMVVDPGIHLFGWTREQAIKYMTASGQMGPEEASVLVDRIVVYPGQLTAYDTGATEFFRLRKQAEAQLRTKFDIRKFHSVVLENGAVTLPMLRDQVQHWIRSQQAQAGSTN